MRAENGGWNRSIRSVWENAWYEREMIMRMCLLLCMVAAVSQAQFYRARIYDDSVVYHPKDNITASDGSCLIVGGVVPDSTDSGDVFIMKVSRCGDKMWTKRYGGEGRDGAVGIEATQDGNFLIAGNTSSGTGGIQRIYLLKITTEGDTLWTRTASTGSSSEILNMSTHSDGTFLLCGRTGRMDGGSDDMLICNADGKGDTLWTRTFGDSARWDQAHVTATTSIGNILVGGSRADTGGYMIIEPSGSAWWETRWGSPSYILPLEGGQYLITRNWYGDFSGDISVINISAMLQNRVWSLDHKEDFPIAAGPLVRSGDNAFYQFAIRMSYSIGIVMKVGHDGKKLWEKTFPVDNLHRIIAITRLADGNYMLCGENNSDNGTWAVSLTLFIDDQYAWKNLPFTF
ncbi:MAG: hypothetical protein JW913_11840 [Chitinispirillaceae bacterium]|nr:hypothetical protein [Chitinispirillaceae bacterium]